MKVNKIFLFSQNQSSAGACKERLLMRYLTVVILTGVIINPILAMADNGTPAECTSADLSIVGKNGGQDFLYEIGDDLIFKVTGPCITKVKAELSKPAASQVLKLLLAGVQTTGLDISAHQIEKDKDLKFGFNLDRKPNEKENREAWDKLLRKQADYVMNPTVALAVGNEPALSVQPPPKPFQFYIAKRGTVWLTLAVALTVFVVAYYLLIKNPTALRDSKGGYYSLGKSQMAFWGLLVLLTFACIWILTGAMERIPDQVLILLGISGATGLSAMVIGENNKSKVKSERETKVGKLRDEYKKLEEDKKASGGNFPKVSQGRLGEIDKEIADLTKVSESDTPKFWSDICDDGNGMSFHRLQVVVWTIVLGVVFVSTVAHVISMPEFSETLLILMGISNGTYLGFKIPEKPGT